MTLINKLPLMTLVLGLGLSATMMSFSPAKKVLDQRYYNTSTGWKTETEITNENPGLVPVCVGEEPTLCSGIYSDTETLGVDTPDSPAFGTYTLIEE